MGITFEKGRALYRSEVELFRPKLKNPVHCEHCEGKGYEWQIQCSKPWVSYGNCCGGCTVKVECDWCSGDGWVEGDEPEEESNEEATG